ncbi:hypothetical protein GTP44_17115 [Duganella sp. FT50W]|uniref:Uncharacterized protein n=2 Tax=Duganella lactea TaxID=2692173 RepID=A0A6L8MQY0_9BURK|nr:hypothetical protein [Duganella lactea]MYM83668.1 hypothetical protein [Duganella lactea]
MAAIGLIASGAVVAHESPAKYGDIVKSASDLSVELSNSDGKTALYMRDHDEDVAMGGATGALTGLAAINFPDSKTLSLRFAVR